MLCLHAIGSVFNQTGGIWALFLGLSAIMLYEVPDEKIPQRAKRILLIGICILAFPADWSCMYAVIYCIFIHVVYGVLQMAVVLSIPFLAGYNGERGKWKGMKWFFYLYYPLHLVFCRILRIMLHGNISIT